MSAVNVSMCRLTCDTCGKHREALTLGATVARIEAAAEGWKYVQYDIKGNGLQQRVPDPRRDAGAWTVLAAPKQWDCCPDCELPTAEEANAIAKQKQAKA